MGDFDAIVLGTGPAGLAALEAIARAGLSAVAVSPTTSVWRSCYGVWRDEADALELEPALAERWERVEVRLDERRSFPLGRTYARVDNAALFARLRDGAVRAGAALMEGRAVHISRSGARTRVELEDGRRLHAWAVLDARGHRPYRTGRRGPLAQVAYGVVLTPKPGALAPGAARLMDFSDRPGADPKTPTFLYALPLADGAFLLEETSLARAPAADLEALRAGLADRLVHLGVEGEARLEERVYIPLDPPLPARDGGPIPLGAAAGLVNPLSGYLLPAALRHAREVAALLAEARAGGIPFEEASRAAWDQTWTPERRLGRKLRRFGIDVLARLDLEGTRGFFEALFSSSPDGWRALLSHDAASERLVHAMLAAFRALPGRLRLRAGAGLSRHLDLLVHLSRTGGVPGTGVPRRSHVGRPAKPRA